MKTCTCSGNSEIRETIGRFICGCGGTLDTQSVLRRLLARIADLEADQMRFIGAFLELGLRQCAVCTEWTKTALDYGDQFICLECIERNETLPFDDEDLDSVQSNNRAEAVVAFLLRHGRPVRSACLQSMANEFKNRVA